MSGQASLGSPGEYQADERGLVHLPHGQVTIFSGFWSSFSSD